jgi:hypothetical protein
MRDRQAGSALSTGGWGTRSIPAIDTPSEPRPRFRFTGVWSVWLQVLACGGVRIARTRRRGGSRLRIPLRWSCLRPGLLLPLLQCCVIALDRPPRGLLPRPAVALRQPPGALDCVREVAQPPDHRLHPRRRHR